MQAVMIILYELKLKKRKRPTAAPLAPFYTKTIKYI